MKELAVAICYLKGVTFFNSSISSWKPWFSSGKFLFLFRTAIDFMKREEKKENGLSRLKVRLDDAK